MDNQHTQIPDILTTYKQKDKDGNSLLKAGDKIIYATIRRYMDKDRKCYPSISTLKASARCSQDKVLDAIKRLKNAHLIEVSLVQNPITGRWANLYYFPETEFDKKFEMFTYEFLDMDLPINVKEYYMDIQQWLVDKETGVGKCYYSNAEIAKKTGRDIKSVKKYNTELIKKGYLQEAPMENQRDAYGLPVIQKSFNLEDLNQAQLWVKAVNQSMQQTTENTDRIAVLEQQVAELLAEKQRRDKEDALARNFTPTAGEYSF